MFDFIMIVRMIINCLCIFSNLFAKHSQPAAQSHFADLFKENHSRSLFRNLLHKYQFYYYDIR